MMLPQEAQDSLAALDPDFAMTCGFVPAPKRHAVQTLLAFYAHLIGIVYQARDPMLGEIKLQWWRDVFEGKRDQSEAQAHPLAQTVLETLVRHALPAHGLADMVDAVTDFLYAEPPEDLTALEYACGRIYSVLMRYASLILADGQDSGPAGLAGPAGVAYGLVRVLSDVPLMRRGSHVMIPIALFKQAGLDDTQFHTLRDREALQLLLQPLIELAHKRLDEFRADFKQLPPALRPAFAVMGLVGPRLERLHKDIKSPSYNPDTVFDDFGPLRQVFYQWRTAAFGRV